MDVSLEMLSEKTVPPIVRHPWNNPQKIKVHPAPCQTPVASQTMATGKHTANFFLTPEPYFTPNFLLDFFTKDELEMGRNR